ASAGIQDPERAAAFLESYPLFDVLRGLPLSSHHWHAVLTRWLELGLLWWLAGILLLPTSKLYQQGVIILFWLPGLLALLSNPQIRNAWRQPAALLLALFAIWSASSAAWSTVPLE